MADTIVDVVTNQGTFSIQLDAAKAPKSVANFLEYVDADHYANTVFHRVIPTFMVQGGGYDAQYERKATKPGVQNEADNGLKNTRGTVAMARTGDPHSATAQFFINVKDNDFLNPTVIPPGDPVPRFEHQGRVYENVPRANLINAPQLWGYTVFGKVTKGMDVVEKIKMVPTRDAGGGNQNVPVTPVLIESIKIIDSPKK